MSQFQSLRGMGDILPEHTHIWQKVELLAQEHFDRAGLKEIRTPLIELTELFARGIGENTDVVGKEMYTFLDRGGRSCTLRPEGTASVVRSVVQHGLLTNGPQRLWYRGPMFRYERPQAGRQRQFHQIGVECIGGSTLPLFDAEIIALGWDFLHSLGLTGLTLELNTLGDHEDRKRYRSQLVSWLEEHYEHLDQDSRQRLRTNPLRILDSKNSQTQSLLEDAPSLMNVLSEGSLKRFEDLKYAIELLEIPYKFNPRLVRGLDYYCHTAFEITTDQLGAQGTVCGGGRYDGLIKELGGESESAIGWAIGMDRLILLLDNLLKQEGVPDVYMVNRGEQAQSQALKLSRKLRNSGLKVELDRSGSSFSKQFKKADRCRAVWALVFGEEEVAKGEVRVKRLDRPQGSNLEAEVTRSSTDIDGLLELLSVELIR